MLRVERVQRVRCPCGGRSAEQTLLSGINKARGPALDVGCRTTGSRSAWEEADFGLKESLKQSKISKFPRLGVLLVDFAIVGVLLDSGMPDHRDAGPRLRGNDEF